MECSGKWVCTARHRHLTQRIRLVWFHSVHLSRDLETTFSSFTKLSLPLLILIWKKVSPAYTMSIWKVSNGKMIQQTSYRLAVAPPISIWKTVAPESCLLCNREQSSVSGMDVASKNQNSCLVVFVQILIRYVYPLYLSWLFVLTFQTCTSSLPLHGFAKNNKNQSECLLLQKQWVRKKRS